MRVELFYFDGCPNWTVAEDRLIEALRTVGRDDVTLERRKVETPAAARAAGFTGSPTIRIDDRDPFATDEQVGLSCRVYPTPDGFRGSPTVDQFIEVLS
jgi:hypothetical protein